MKSKFSILFLILILLFSCSKDEIQYIELTSGREMDRRKERFGVKIKSDNYIYFCKEIMDVNPDNYDYHSGKYSYYKSISKVDFMEYQALVFNNFSRDKVEVFNPIPDETAFQIKFQFTNAQEKLTFYPEYLNEKQIFIFEMLERLKYKKFKPIDSIEFSKDLLQEKLPEPPKF
ncbi:hypothetical protein [Epilithonimonas xixisoli]|nr:hypothetical protein [Epilithonimonas xixisoli]